MSSVRAPEIGRWASAQTASSPGCPFCGHRKTERLYQRQYQDKVWSLAKCLDCGLHFTDPQPTAREIEAFYAGDYHEELRDGGATEQAFREKYEAYTAWIRQIVPSGRTLDIGCATGLFPSMLRSCGYEAEGLEMNSASAAWGQSHYGIPIHTGTLEDAGLPEASYDLVTMTDVLEHTLNPVDCLMSLHRLLKPRGHVLVTFPDIRSVESRYYRGLARATGRGWIWKNCHIPLHTWEFTRATATATFEKAGFRVIGCRRSQLNRSLPGRLFLFSLPPRILKLPILSNYLGTQMEFMLARSGN